MLHVDLRVHLMQSVSSDVHNETVGVFFQTARRPYLILLYVYTAPPK